MTSFGFIIPTCCQNDIHFRQLNRCLDSIFKFHPNTNVILVDDSFNDLYDLNKSFESNANITIIKSCVRGSADQQVFKVFRETNLFDKAILIQDSMSLNKKLEGIDDVVGVKFLWHFTNHRVHWDIIQEKPTKYNEITVSHTELIKLLLQKDYSEQKEFLNWALNKLDNKSEWCGCFGSCCVITREVLQELDHKTSFIDKFIEHNYHSLKQVNESIFSLMCHYAYPTRNFEDSYDGIYWDGFNVNASANKSTGFDDLKWCCVNQFFSKIAFSRHCYRDE